MGWGYNNYGYDAPRPLEVDDVGVEGLIDELKNSIDDNKLKDMKSVLSKLKVTINDKYPLFTRDVAPFGAYLYAINNNKKKGADSALAMILKKNYSYDGFPMDILIENTSVADFKIIINDILNISTQWNLEGIDTIKTMFTKYPAETETFIASGRLNKYTKGEARVETTKLIIELGGGDAIVGALKSFFGQDYVEKYGINSSKLADLFAAVDGKSADIKRKVRIEYFYKVAVKSITVEVLEKDYNAGLLDDEAIKSYAAMMDSNYRSTLLVTLRNMKNEELRLKLISSSDSLLTLITKDYPDLMPQAVQDIFLF